MANLSKLTEDLFLGTPENIVSVGYGFKRVKNSVTNTKAIIFGVRAKKLVSELDPKEIIPQFIVIDEESIPTDVVEFKSPFMAFSNCFEANDISSDDHRTRKRPILGGISIGLGEAGSGTGTLGTIVKDNEDANCCILSNVHVLTQDQFINSDKNASLTEWNTFNKEVFQPGIIDGGNTFTSVIGGIKRYYPLKLNDINYIDAALSSVGEFYGDGTSVEFLGLGNSNALPFATTAEIDSIVTDNITLYKSGRTTGFIGNNSCLIKPLQLHFSVSVGGYLLQGDEQLVDFADTIIFAYEDVDPITGHPRENVAVPGDSGSMLIGDFNGTKKIIGLFFAGGSSNGIIPNNIGIACRIDKVAELLNISNWNGVNFKYGNHTSWLFEKVEGLSDIIKYEKDGRNYWQIGTIANSGSLDSYYMSATKDILTMCLYTNKCDGSAPNIECPTPAPPSTETEIETETETPPEIPDDPRANYNFAADWNEQDGNITTVGTNGPPSAYSTYDQNGNVWEITDTKFGPNPWDGVYAMGGAWNTDAFYFNKCDNISNVIETAKDSNLGIRLYRAITNNSSPTTLYAHTCGIPRSIGGRSSFISVFDRTDILSFSEKKRILNNKMLDVDSCNITSPSNIVGTKNGRSIFVYNNTIFMTMVNDSKIYTIDLSTGQSTGDINTSIMSMSTIAYDGTYYYTTDYSGQKLVYVLDPNTGSIVRTIQMQIPPTTTLPFWTFSAHMDGLEYFDGKLIMNRGDYHPIYDIYDLNGNVLVENFINVYDANIRLDPVLDQNETGASTSYRFKASMGITYDGTNFIVSLYNENGFGSTAPNMSSEKLHFGIFRGNDGKFLGHARATLQNCNQAIWEQSYHTIEDLSIDYDSRPDIGETFFTEWSYVDDNGNAPDTVNCNGNYYGDVNYNYRIQRYELTNNEYAFFLNAVADSDPYGLYDERMGTDPKGGINRSGSPGSYVYSVKTHMGDKPVIFVDWFCGARLANWLHNRVTNPSTTETETGAYSLNGETTNYVVADPNALFRLPTIDEWYKAAYYKGGGTNTGYWGYAMETDDKPCGVSATSNGNGSACSYIP